MVCFGIPGMRWGVAESVDIDYVEHLEDKVNRLERQVYALRQANREARALNRELEARLMKETDHVNDQDLETIFGIVLIHED